MDLISYAAKPVEYVLQKIWWILDLTVRLFRAVIQNVQQGTKVISTTVSRFDQTITLFAMVLLNTGLSLLILLEEIIVVFLVLPWTPTKRVGQIFYFLRRWGFPGKLTFVVYIVFGIVIVLLNLVGLELYYLQINEEFQNIFNEFRASLFTSLKLFIVVHRFLNLLSNEAALRSTCRALKKQLKLEQGDDALEFKDGEFTEEDEEVEKLKTELEQMKHELLASRAIISKLQHQSDIKQELKTFPQTIRR